ncbi:MAG: aldehyde ferredoxin oxidoreductase family protein [Spirochaetales bacterium]|nr:aldehyde ferredoxin oxidoreductase family protein [Spirochaetales bacterium]MCF7938300.1 aldehyde ferredoxin oxidoreductase family protein [Spirochaetales bacterium]
MKGSFWGKKLVVDLSKGTCTTEDLPEYLAENYLGQKGLGARIIMEDVPTDTDPLSPENELVFSTGVMTGTIVSCSAKLAISAKSPLTGTITDGSVGGHAGAELKYAGYDAVVIKGRAPELSYLYISPDKCEIKASPELKGLGTFETDDRIRKAEEDEEIKVLAIGPAGENQVLYACVSSERYRQLGRGGIGTVFGNKNLKAVAVRGWLGVQVPDVQKCMETAAHYHKADGIIDKEYEIYDDGTPMLVNLSQESGLLPTRNFQEGTYEHYEKINSESLKEVRQNKKACFSCGIACGNYVVDGDARVEGPEYETIALLGSSIDNPDRAKLIELNAVCDDLGLDTISAGGVIAYMMEMTEKGKHDFGIRFGETDKALELVRKITYREGIGDEAAGGSKRLAEKYGGAEFAIQVKGQELPGYDPRGSWAMGIAFATAPRGGCHMSAYPIELEAWGTLDPFTFEGKAKLVADMQNAQFAKFSMGVCDFWPVESETLAKLFEVTYGGDWTAAKVDKAGERIFNIQRMYNIMVGFEGREDTLPQRFFKEILKDGPPKDHPMTEDAFNATMQEYYTYRGWDKEGRPTIERLEELEVEPELIDRYRAVTGL